MGEKIQPGDVLVIRTSSWQARWIRLGAALAGKPNLDNHVAVAHHRDAHGTLWVIEGRPGGAGWRDATAYLSSPLLLTNAAQPKTDVQRRQVTLTMEALIGTGYDWQAIAADAFTDLGWRMPGWNPSFAGTVAVQADCSALAAYGYAKNSLACPPGDRGVQPADWDQFILDRAWERT